MAQLESRRVMISTGTYPSKTLPTHITHARPFMHQIDVVFPSDPKLEDAFRRLETEYYTSRGRLSDVVDGLKTLYEQPDAHPPTLIRDVQVLSTGTHVADVWSVRGADLRINVAKRTYEALGLEGTKMPGAHGRFKGCEEQYALKLPCGLKRPALGAKEHDKHYPRMRAKLEQWDTARDAAGEPRWAFAFTAPRAHLEKAPGPLSPSHADVQRHAVRPVVRTYGNVRVPVPALTPRPEGKQRKRRKLAHSSDATDEVGDVDGALEDWEAEMEGLFEWVGMAVIGSQRLQANDRVDPYVAVYSPPEGSTTGEVTRVRWKGFFTPSFVDSVLNVISQNLSPSSASSSAKPFVALTVHGVPHTPSQDKDRQVPRMEGEGENTCSMVMVPKEGLEETDSQKRNGAEVEGAAMDVITPDNGKTVENGKKERLLGRYVMVEVAAQWDRTFG